VVFILVVLVHMLVKRGCLSPDAPCPVVPGRAPDAVRPREGACARRVCAVGADFAIRGLPQAIRAGRAGHAVPRGGAGGAVVAPLSRAAGAGRRRRRRKEAAATAGAGREARSIVRAAGARSEAARLHVAHQVLVRAWGARLARPAIQPGVPDVALAISDGPARVPALRMGGAVGARALRASTARRRVLARRASDTIGRGVAPLEREVFTSDASQARFRRRRALVQGIFAGCAQDAVRLLIVAGRCKILAGAAVLARAGIGSPDGPRVLPRLAKRAVGFGITALRRCVLAGNAVEAGAGVGGGGCVGVLACIAHVACCRPTCFLVFSGNAARAWAAGRAREPRVALQNKHLL
jgi:hypothetical protein